MISLEQAIKEARKYQEDLTARIIVQEEISHYETDWSGAGKLQGYDRQLAEKEELIIDQHKITEPDTQKQEEAKAKLKEIFETSPWISARYLAGKASYGIAIPFGEWVFELEKGLRSNSKDKRIKAVVDLARWYDLAKNENPRSSQSLRLKEILKITYNHNTSAVERIAGKALGYTKLRLLVHAWRRGYPAEQPEEGHGGAGWQYIDKTGQRHKGHK